MSHKTVFQSRCGIDEAEVKELSSLESGQICTIVHRHE